MRGSAGVTSLATRGNIMAFSNLNESMSEEMFGGDLDVTEEPEIARSQVRRIREYLHRTH